MGARRSPGRRSPRPRTAAPPSIASLSARHRSEWALDRVTGSPPRRPAGQRRQRNTKTVPRVGKYAFHLAPRPDGKRQSGFAVREHKEGPSRSVYRHQHILQASVKSRQQPTPNQRGTSRCPRQRPRDVDATEREAAMFHPQRNQAEVTTASAASALARENRASTRTVGGQKRFLSGRSRHSAFKQIVEEPPRHRRTKSTIEDRECDTTLARKGLRLRHDVIRH